MNFASSIRRWVVRDAQTALDQTPGTPSIIAAMVNPGPQFLFSLEPAGHHRVCGGNAVITSQ